MSPISRIPHPVGLESLITGEGRLKGYVQYPGTDTRNGGIVEIAEGHRENQIDTIGSIFGLTLETI